ncbi:MAG: hypothetical protein JWO67_6913 [Streptosporangiaceae bacterium]|nr:hypothetical protein [Streptosporangiaceae bacterium]
MDSDDVRVREAAGDRGLAGDPGDLPAAVRAAVAGEDLDRDHPVDLRVVRLPDLPEPTPPRSAQRAGSARPARSLPARLPLRCPPRRTVSTRRVLTLRCGNHLRQGNLIGRHAVRLSGRGPGWTRPARSSARRPRARARLTSTDDTFRRTRSCNCSRADRSSANARSRCCRTAWSCRSTDGRVHPPLGRDGLVGLERAAVAGRRGLPGPYRPGGRGRRLRVGGRRGAGGRAGSRRQNMDRADLSVLDLLIGLGDQLRRRPAQLGAVGGGGDEVQLPGVGVELHGLGVTGERDPSPAPTPPSSSSWPPPPTISASPTSHHHQATSNGPGSTTTPPEADRLGEDGGAGPLRDRPARNPKARCAP